MQLSHAAQISLRERNPAVRAARTVHLRVHEWLGKKQAPLTDAELLGKLADEIVAESIKGASSRIGRAEQKIHRNVAYRSLRYLEKIVERQPGVKAIELERAIDRADIILADQPGAVAVY